MPHQPRPLTMATPIAVAYSNISDASITRPHGTVQPFGVNLVGVAAENGRKLVFTLGFVLVFVISSRILRPFASFVLLGKKYERIAFGSGRAYASPLDRQDQRPERERAK